MLQNIKLWGAALTVGLFTVSAASASLTPVTAVDQSNPDAIVKGAVDNSFQILDKYKTNHSSSNQALVAEIKNNVLPYFDTQYISASILGPYFRTSQDHFKEFVGVMEDYMVNAYIEGLDFYNGQRVSQSPARQRSDTTASAIVTVFDRSPIPVEFTLKNRQGKYRIIDFNALGISIVQTKTSEWRPILSAQGVTGLISYIKSHNTNILGNYKK